MANGDIRTRKTTGLNVTPTGRVSGSSAQGIDSSRILTAAERALEQQTRNEQARLNAEKAAREKANTLFLRDYQNRLDSVVNNSQAELGDMEGLDAQESYTKIKTKVKQQFDELAKAAPSDVSQQVQILNNGALVKFDSFGVNHITRQNDKYWDDVYKNRANFLTNDIVRTSISGGAEFQKKLAELETVTAEHLAGRRGIPSDNLISKQQVEQTRSNAILKAVEAFKQRGDFNGGRAFFNRYKGFLTSTDEGRAEAFLKQAESGSKNTLALQVVNDAHVLHPNNPELRRKYIDSQTKGDGDLNKAAISIESVRRNLMRNEETFASNKAMGDAFEYVRSNQGRIPPQEILNRVSPEERAKVYEFAVNISEGKLVQTNWETYNNLRDQIERGDRVILQSGISHAYDRLNDRQRDTLQKMLDRKRISIQQKKEDISLKHMSNSLRTSMVNMLRPKDIIPNGSTKEQEQFNTYMSIGDELYNDVSEEMAKKGVIDIKEVEAEVRKRFALEVERGISKAEVQRTGWFIRIFDEEKTVELTDAEITRLKLEVETGERDAIFDMDSPSEEDERLIRHIEKQLSTPTQKPSRGAVQRAFDEFKLKRLRSRR